MHKSDVHLLDCTLRDGGYINDWRFGFDTAKEIIKHLTISGIDVVEVGFLRNVEEYDPDVMVCKYIEELNRLLPEHNDRCMYSAMMMRSNYDISNLSPYSGKGIELIRVTAHEYDIEEGFDFAKEVKAKGYKVSINPINIMGYSDEKILWMVSLVNEIHPYQFSIVDTFGSMKRRDLDRIVSLIDNNLEKDIRLGLHLHENMSLSCCLAQSFLDKHIKRDLTIDGSLLGMGRVPGNLPIELMVDYVNDYFDKRYDIDYLMDAINEYILPIKGEAKWGYTPAYFLSAKYNLHRNYSEYYLDKGDLTNRDINCILQNFEEQKKAVFDETYARQRYELYKNNSIDDAKSWNELNRLLCDKNILILAPGASITSHQSIIKDFINSNTPIVISTNFVPVDFDVNYAFFSNSKRYNLVEQGHCKFITTSNLSEQSSDFKINYNRVSGVIVDECNSLLLLLKMLKEMHPRMISIAGADGYKADGKNYYTSSMNSTVIRNEKYNIEVKEAIYKLGIDVRFITPSEYI